MPKASVKPFDFDEFEGPNEAVPERSFLQEDIDKAYQEGAACASAEHAADLVKRQTDILKTIRSEFNAAQQDYVAALDGERAALKAIADEFLNVFCTQFYSANEAALAGDLLDRLLQNTNDRTPACISLSAENFADVEAHLQAIIIDRNIADLIAINRDPELAAGECRIDWRGGSISRELEPVREAIAAMIDAERPRETQPEQSK